MNAGIAEMSFARVPLCLIDHSLSHIIPVVVTAYKNNNKNLPLPVFLKSPNI
tara:strand:+ start:160 stop:315 length:156 start_codon:yes stop_codon:yes gene_type:complete